MQSLSWMVYGVRNKLIFVKKSIPYYEQGERIYVQLCLVVCGNGRACFSAGDLFLSQRPEFLRADTTEKSDVSDRELGNVSLSDRLDRVKHQSLYPDPKSIKRVTKAARFFGRLYILIDKNEVENESNRDLNQKYFCRELLAGAAAEIELRSVGVCL